MDRPTFLLGQSPLQGVGLRPAERIDFQLICEAETQQSNVAEAINCIRNTCSFSSDPESGLQNQSLYNDNYASLLALTRRFLDLIPFPLLLLLLLLLPVVARELPQEQLQEEIRYIKGKHRDAYHLAYENTNNLTKTIGGFFLYRVLSILVSLPFWH